jgi:hypothetical protein
MPRIDLTDLQQSDFAFGVHARRREEGGESGLPGGELREAWGAVAEVLGLCQDGDFSGLPRLAGLMTRVEGYLYRSAIVNVVGCAGSWGLIERFVAGLEGVIPDHEAHMFAARALSLSCHAAAVGPLLRLYPKANDLDERLTVSHELSFLLEEGPGPIWMGADEEEGGVAHARIEAYAALLQDVARVRGALPQDAPGGAMPPDARTLFEGASLDVVGTTRKLLARLGAADLNEEWAFRESLVFGAATGVDCTPFWTRDYALQRLNAIAIVEEFLDGPEAGRFEPGRRYFFGHPVPS